MVSFLDPFHPVTTFQADVRKTFYNYSVYVLYAHTYAPTFNIQYFVQGDHWIHANIEYVDILV